jgi:hypothetical protein
VIIAETINSGRIGTGEIARYQGLSRA